MEERRQASIEAAIAARDGAAICRALSERATPLSVSDIATAVSLLDSEDAQVRRAAANRLAEAGGRAVYYVHQRFLQLKRFGGAAGALRLYIPEGLIALAPLCRSGNPDEETGRAIADLLQPVPGLAQGNHIACFADAISELAATPTSWSQALLLGLCRQGDTPLALRLIPQLIKVGGEEQFCEIVRSGRISNESKIAEALTHGGPLGQSTMRALMRDGFASARSCGVLAAGLVHHPEAETVACVARLLADTEPTVLERACKSFAAIVAAELREPDESDSGRASDFRRGNLALIALLAWRDQGPQVAAATALLRIREAAYEHDATHKLTRLMPRVADILPHLEAGLRAVEAALSVRPAGLSAGRRIDAGASADLRVEALAWVVARLGLAGDAAERETAQRTLMLWALSAKSEGLGELLERYLQLLEREPGAN